MFATQSRQTFTGTITDEECPSADHSGMRMGSTDAACAIACVDDHTVEFVLFDGEATYLLSDQDKSREFAGKKGSRRRHAGLHDLDDPGHFNGRGQVTHRSNRRSTSSTP